MGFNVKIALGIFAVCLTYNVVHSARISACSVTTTDGKITSNDLESSYSCTIDRIKATFENCTATSCLKKTTFINYLDTQLHPAIVSLTNDCTNCSGLVVNLVRNVLRLVVFVANELFSVLDQVVNTVGAKLVISVVTEALDLVKNLIKSIDGTATGLISALDGLLVVVVQIVRAIL